MILHAQLLNQQSVGLRIIDVVHCRWIGLRF